MDANGTRFHLLLGQDDWARCRQRSRVPGGESLPLGELWKGLEGQSPLVAWDEKRASITLQPRLFHFLAAPRDVPPSLEDRRGAGRDRYGNFYWVDKDQRTLRVKSSGSGNTSTFWPPEPRPAPPSTGGEFSPVRPAEPPPPPTLGGLAVTTHHYLVVGTVAPAGLLVFDLHAGGPPLRLLWPIDFVPFDLSPTSDGGVLVLDRQHRRVWRLDAHFRVLHTRTERLLQPESEDPFQPEDGRYTHRTPAETFPEGLSLDDASPLVAEDPIALEALPDGGFLVLDRGERDGHVLLYRDGTLQGEPVPLVLSGILAQEGAFSARLVGHDFAFVPDRLYVVSADGNQTFVFLAHEEEGQLTLTPLPEYFPMRLFGGKALLASGDQLFYDFSDGFIPLVSQRRPRYEPEAVLLTDTFDGRTPDCVWHRLFLDACIPPDTAVRVRSRAADEHADLELAPWQQEPALYLRSDGAELPWVPRAKGENTGTWELLFQQARGRYLQLELTLSGTGGSTPRLHALRAWYPRFSYSERYLPAIYRQEPDAASFLERFLANIEGFFTTLEERIAAVQVLFDARSAPTETLDWLAGWFGMAMDPAWDERRRRLFLRHAPEFFQWRGTPRGLRMALRLALDECPDESIFQEDEDPRRSRFRIREHFRTARPSVVFQAPATTPEGIRVVVQRKRWEPSQGGDSLTTRYAEALEDAGLPAPQRFPVRHPEDEATAAVWTSFSREVLGFVPAATEEDTERWRDFLARRYPGTRDFSEAPLPTTLPEDGEALMDWYHFETVVRPTHRAAHRFTVVLPVPKGGTAEQHRERLEQARRVVALEKPAHTVFDVAFYWAMFRVGEARLGVDSLIDLGSRAPELMPPAVVGRTHLAESFLAPSHPGNVADRHILGRDRLVGRPTNGREKQ